MSKINLPVISSGYLSTEALTQAMSEIEDAINNTLSRDGSTPNQMEADLDLNGHKLLNVEGDLADPESLLTVGQMQGYVDGKASGLVMQRVERQTATAGQTVFTLTTATFSPNANNLAIYVNGSRKFATADFVENSVDTVTFVTGLSAGDKVVFVTNDYVATVDLPEHQHPWSDLLGAPIYTTRWPDWSEVTGKPTTFEPATHTHAASAITTGRLADAQRGVFVQSTQPSTPTTGDLWLW